MTAKARAQFPSNLRRLFQPQRYKILYGGRGSAKSWSAARALLIQGANRPLRVLCGREIQNSIHESVHKLLSTQIDALGFQAFYRPFERVIRGINGTEFVFRGLKNNITAVKSMEAIDIVWVEEAEKVSDRSWQTLIPTIRKPGSEVWATFNPDEETDATYRRFVTAPPPDAWVQMVNWRHNPWFPDELRREMEYLRSVDYDAYLHVWEGQCRKRSDAQVFNGKWRVEWFEPKPGWDGPYQGVDWGFASDPSVMVRVWIDRTTDKPRLMVEREAWGLRVDLDNLPALFDRIPRAREFVTRADNARPETISYMTLHGYPNVTAAEKWAGSVEDGIAYLRAFAEIVIHPDCTHTIEEARLYSYKIDRVSGDVLPDLVDKHNHCWDAIRYALGPMIRQGLLGMLHWVQEAAQDQAKAEDMERKMRALTGG
jgi:phage terminase large subunit